MTGTDELEAMREFVGGATVTAWFRDSVRENPDAPALRWKVGDGWGTATYADVADQVVRVAGALRDLGVGPGDRVLLMLRNRPEFHVADLAALLLRATPISVYNSSSADQLLYLAGHSRAKVAIVDDAEFLGRLTFVKDRLPHLEHLVVVDGEAPDGVLSFADLLSGAPVDMDAAVAAARPDDLVTVIYTSGTTGDPKGVMLDHSNIAWQIAGYGMVLVGTGRRPSVEPDRGTASLAMIGDFPLGTRNLSFLPMAHVAERMVTHYAWLFLRSEVTCCPDQLQLLSYLIGTRPHTVFGPPRVWEKLTTGIRMAVAAGGPEKAAGFAQAVAVGEQVDALRRSGRPVPEALESALAGADAAAFAPLRAMIGLDAAAILFSGAAPLPVEVAIFLRAIGLPFSEVYGMSENTGGMTWSPYSHQPGTVGHPWPGAEVRLADDGEVLCRGGIVSRGYLDDPVRTADTFDADGWLHTGDIGSFTDDGALRIVDRKKELIITAGGKNISPANIEARLKSIPLVGQAAVIGDGRPYLVAVLVLEPDVARAWAAAQGIEGDLAGLAADERVLAEVQRGVDEVSTHFSRVEQIKRFTLVGDEWQPDSEQLTATMKLKRRGVTKAYGATIEQMYA